MKYLKILIVVVAFLCCDMMTCAYSVYMRNSDTAYSSAEIDRVVLNADHSASVYFKAGGSETIPASEFIGVSLIKPDSGVEAVDDDLTDLVMKEGYITAHGRLTVSDIDGRVLLSSVNGRVYVGDLRPGVYVITNGNKSTKLLLR